MFTKRVSTRADPKPAVLGGAYALRPRPARRLAGDDRSWGRVSGNARASSPRLAARRRRAYGAHAGLDARLATFSNKKQVLPRQAVGGCAVVRLCGGEEHRVSVGARTRALRQLTRCDCLSATNAVSEASFAARPKPEHRSAVGAPLAPTAAPARQRTPAHGLAHASTSTTRTFDARKGPAAEARFICRSSQPARWSH
jgi:hypothetical protein